jgi:hypothetical protein
VSGSWLFSPDSPTGASILGGIICKEIAYEELGLERDFGDTRKNNKRVLRYNMSYEPEIIGEDETTVYFLFSKEKFNKIKLGYIEQCTKIMQQEMLHKTM